jgi:hypothetical protein
MEKLKKNSARKASSSKRKKAATHNRHSISFNGQTQRNNENSNNNSKNYEEDELIGSDVAAEDEDDDDDEYAEIERTLAKQHPNSSVGHSKNNKNSTSDLSRRVSIKEPELNYELDFYSGLGIGQDQNSSAAVAAATERPTGHNNQRFVRKPILKQPQQQNKMMQSATTKTTAAAGATLESSTGQFEKETDAKLLENLKKNENMLACEILGEKYCKFCIECHLRGFAKMFEKKFMHESDPNRVIIELTQDKFNRTDHDGDDGDGRNEAVEQGAQFTGPHFITHQHQRQRHQHSGSLKENPSLKSNLILLNSRISPDILPDLQSTSLSFDEPSYSKIINKKIKDMFRT